MATLKTRWLLSIWVVSLSKCFASAGPPAPPSRPVCFIPCDEKCQVDIHCTWELGQDPQTITDYTLHWEPVHSEHPHVTNGTSLNELIHRKHFSSHDDLLVWVEAKNQHGSAKSEKAKFNTAEIFKPSPPAVKEIQQEPLEICWTSTCNQLHFFVGHCDFQYRTETDKDWVQVTNLHSSYTIEHPQPCTVYEFQIRCACDTGLMSDWNAVHRIDSTKSAPVGEMDVWRDCGIFPESSDCVLTWKKLPQFQACGLILGYEVRLSYNDGTAVSVNTSTAEPSDLLVCEGMQCHFNSSLKDGSSVNVLAYNPYGASVPSYLSVPITGKGRNMQEIHLKMTEENLTVSWERPSVLSDYLKEYVVQYKQAGCPLSQGFDWVKVNKNQTTATFEGRFQKYTPYQVSLLKVLHNNQVHHLSSVVGYSLQGPPSKVPNVHFSTDTHETLTWEPIPLLKQNGTILYYQIGVDGQNVFSVSASKTSEELPLSPGREHKVWIRAVTAAGPGEITIITIETKPHSGYLKSVWTGISVVVLCVSVILLCACCAGKKVCLLMPPCFYEKVPDPRNSHIFRQVKNQINDSLVWTCSPVCEPPPKISLLEVVEIPSWAFKSSTKKTSDPEGLTRPMVGDSCSQMDCIHEQREDAVTEECHRTDLKYGKQAYSKIVDSDEEKGVEEEEEERKDCWNSSTEEVYESGYEKHFMPTALEILEVS
uniref:interleukin 12 receptor, beta 2a, like n=1 Tax=Semicossyphus pulcher TaxID=241346 RepID=UPI0037E7C83A